MAPALEQEELNMAPVHFKHHTFSSPASYFKGLAELPKRLYYRFFYVWTPNQELTKVKERSGVSMKATLEWWDMVFFGIGAMVGAGIFVSTGAIASDTAGPAVIMSFLVSGVSALLSALCYSEFAIEVPTAGGAFTYLRITMGEFFSFLTAGNLIMEYVLSAAAVARGFTSYFSTVFGNTDNTNAWRIYVPSLAEGFQYLDPVAVALIILLTILLCWGIKESAWTNLITTIIHLLLMFFIIIAAFVKGSGTNLVQPDGFAPFGAAGVFKGAASAYFSYIGFDAVATMAEECKNPAVAVPVGIIGSVSFSIILYCLMALAIGLMVPYNEIDINAPYSVAFQAFGWNWAVIVVGLGATLGTITSCMMSLLGQARYLTMIGRSHMVPLWFAKINSWRKTPINSTVVLGVASAILAFFSSLDFLIGLVSIGTLFVFFMVAQALLIRHHYVKGQNRAWPILTYLIIFDLTGVAFAICFWLIPDVWWPLLFLGLLAIAETVALHFLVPRVYYSPTWTVPGAPWLVSASIFLNVFLLGSLDEKSYIDFGIFSACLVGMYLLYSVHASWDLEGEGIEIEDDDEEKPHKPQVDVDNATAEPSATVDSSAPAH